MTSERSWAPGRNAKTLRSNTRRVLSGTIRKLGLHVASATDPGRMRSILKRYWPVKIEGIELVRLGGDSDGGYLVPDDFEGITSCLSPGVGRVAGFENDLASRGIGSHMADFSVEEPPENFAALSFTRKFVGPVTQGDTVSLSDWVDRLPDARGDMILQMDIEGGEYATILATPRSLLNEFRILVIELHGVHALADPAFATMFSGFTDSLLENHSVVHLHPNNYFPPVRVRGVDLHPILEVTLLRNDRIGRRAGYVSSFPHPHDRANVADRPDPVLAADWHAPSGA